MVEVKMMALEGIKVLDLSRVLATPGAGMYLADQGADVVKVEPIGGESGRYGTTSAVAGLSKGFMVVNRNKRSICLDIKTNEGKEIIHKLVCQADVLLHNFRKGVPERLGIDYDTLSKLNPRLIYVHLWGWGEKGPIVNNISFDLLVQAYTGAVSRRRYPDGSPVTPGVWVGDCGTPVFLAYGVAMALFMRERTGRGQKVETSLLNTIIAVQSTFLVKGEAEAAPKDYSDDALLSNYRCADGKFVQLVAGGNENWLALCRAMGLEHLIADPNYATPLDRAERRDELYRILQDAFLTRSRDEWMKIFYEQDVPGAPVLETAEVFTLPQVVENKMIVEVEHPVAGRIWMMNAPVRLSDSPEMKIRAAPSEGQHTDEIMREIGYSEENITELRQKKVIS